MKHLKNYNQLFESIVTKRNISYQNLTELPELPDTLEILSCENNNKLPYNDLEGYWKWFHEYYPVHYPEKYKQYLKRKNMKKFNI